MTWFENYVDMRVGKSRLRWIHSMLSSKTRKGKVDSEIIEKIEEWVDVDLVQPTDGDGDPGSGGSDVGEALLLED